MQVLPDATQPTGKIHPISKVTVTFKPNDLICQGLQKNNKILSVLSCCLQPFPALYSNVLPCLAIFNHVQPFTDMFSHFQAYRAIYGYFQPFQRVQTTSNKFQPFPKRYDHLKFQWTPRFQRGRHTLSNWYPHLN